MNTQTRDMTAFHDLKRDHENGSLLIDVNAVKYNRSGSPFYRSWDSKIPGIVILGIVIYGFSMDWLTGIVILGCGVLIFVKLVRKFVMDRVRNRVLDYALSDISSWWRLWKEGDLLIRRGDDHAYSPEGDWIAFILREEHEG